MLCSGGSSLLLVRSCTEQIYFPPPHLFRQDGAFDLLHYGHMNAFRLARSLGTHLIVGLNSDESITECKGPPLMQDDERLTMVSACKFVDEVIPGCPYVVRTLQQWCFSIAMRFQTLCLRSMTFIPSRRVGCTSSRHFY